ncbi:BspA family leucine-rich repeat surface protein [Abyssalbus ytuae]|uniref:BspA family leucine-rich repeat surface protein n=1 Tax=Abyssalbus ytuae TaxID=2926907 RepID=A0A9E6ZQ83_9FLAO|nr:BspA family leucine-rich repeat surface protein [Abyssalbus ytuae]UOB18570.1 BspA family leucine-rich repeat surface protein [Abyssalbus ytuae]
MKNLNKILVPFVFIVLIFSCSKDDGPATTPPQENKAPEISEQSFNVSEDILDSAIIGTIAATDPEEDELTFSITTNSNDLFEITNEGVLSLATGKNLDFETDESHVITVEVSDGELTATASIIVVVIDKDENTTPVIEAQSFTVAEDITDDAEIGTVEATDETTLTYNITTNSNDLFEITDDGILSLAPGQSLDFETAENHTILVEVSDGQLTATAEITIIVLNINEAPVIEAQSFSVAEDITDDTEIGTVMATYETAITFSIATNSNDLFEITNDGVLSLAPGKSLDFETAQTHTITVEVSDGELTSTAEITINVTDIADTNPDAFITVWQTTTASESITIPTNPDYTYSYNVDWGDGTTSENQTGNANHIYDVAGVYTVSITGNFPAIYFNGEGDREKIESIQQWGIIEWKSMERAFYGCSNLTYTATDRPDLSEVTNMEYMFFQATSFNGDLNNWDVSSVKSMGSMFRNATSFNGNISNWDVSSVVKMYRMFHYATSFNQDLSNWNVSSATNMISMFDNASSFNSDISNWNVSSVINTKHMFNDASSFNSDIGNWDVSSVTDMSSMFRNASSFNQDLSSWNTGLVTDMQSMFTGATSFNSDISNWDLSLVTNLGHMFADASSFNGNISNWNVSSVSYTYGMFRNATSFNVDISSWDVSSVTNMYRMFYGATSFNQDLSNWDISLVSDMENMFDDSNLSIENYDATLKGWSELSTAPNDIELGVANLAYCDDGEAARTVLEAKGWTFAGDSKSADCP